MTPRAERGIADAGQWSRGALIELGACPACGARSEHDAVHVRADDQQAMPDMWRMLQCAACASTYLDPRPSNETLGRAYEDYYTHQSDAPAVFRDTPVERAVNGYLNRRFRLNRQPASAWGAGLFDLFAPLRMKLDMFGRHIPQALCDAGGRVLDVGCGNGAFLLRAQQMGLVAKGTEPDPKAVQECVRQGLDVVRDDIYSPYWHGTQFDWITMNHVVEHLDKPEQALERVFELLAPGGGLWLGLPNPEALGFKWTGVGWKGLHPPFHLLIPSQRILRDWLERAGFDEVNFVRRGVQSAGLWRETADLTRREGRLLRLGGLPLVRVLGDVLATIGVRWSEETIVIAKRPAAP